MNIVDLNSDVAGTEEKPVYIMLLMAMLHRASLHWNRRWFL